MIVVDEDALICDFAEVYHVYDWRSLPASYAATLAAGLRGNARIIMKLNNERATFEQLMLASIADFTALAVWQNTVDGHKGENRPQSMLELILKSPESKAEEKAGFEEPEEFMAWRAKMMGGDAVG